MRHFRPHIAWIMLIATFAIALPRTWVHDCNNGYDEHVGHGDAGNYDQIDHESCPLCDYAPASSFQSVAIPYLVAPTTCCAHVMLRSQICAPAQVSACSLRGPPIA